MEKFEISTKVIFGHDSLEFLRSYENKRVFLVSDPFMVESGAISQVTRYLPEGNYKIFSEVVPDPPMELVTKGVNQVIEYGPQVIIALGGGSAIDSAKAIMQFAKVAGQVKEMEFVAIPTTSGTGSEVTSFAVITDPQKGVKYPLVSNQLLPDIAILETELVKSVPPSIVADTGMDVLTHAIEAYVSTKATDFSDALAEKAVSLVFEYLFRSYENENDIEAKEKMHHASCIAGISFNLASLGMNHAIAHNVGGKLHIPHGRTNAILLPHVILFNAAIEGFSPKKYTIAAKKYERLAKIAGISGGNTRVCINNFVHKIQQLERTMKIPQKFRECDVSEEEILNVKQDIAEGAMKDACMATNPRAVTISDVLEIIHQAT